MKQKIVKSFVSVLLVLTLLLPVVSVASSAIKAPSDMRLVSDIETELAPGLISNQSVVYNESGERVALFVSTLDYKNHDDLHIIANYKNNQCDTYGMQKVSEQVAYTEAKHAGEDYRIVNAVNASGFNMTTGRPTGIFVMDGVDYTYPVYNPKYPFFAVLDTGEAIIVPMSDYEKYKGHIKEAVAGFKFLVQNGEIPPEVPSSGYAPRTTIGLTAEGKVIIMVADGRQIPYSAGLTNLQQAKIMQSLGCVTAMEFDGGGSTTYGCRMPGSDHFEVINKPSDGDERAVSGTLMIVSTAKATGTLDKINISSDYEYVSPHSPITFSASGSDSYGFPVDLPDGIEFRLSDTSMGTLDGNVFTAGSKLGDVTLNAYYNGELYGSKTISIVQPEEIVFTKSIIYATYGQSVPLPIAAHYNGMDVSINGGDIYTLLGDIDAIAEYPEINGYIDGLTYYAPDENCGIRSTTLYAILDTDEVGTSLIQAKIELHRESESVFDFSEATVNYGMVAYNRWLTNAPLTSLDEMLYTVSDPEQPVKVNYTMAIDLGQLQLPDYLKPLWDAFGEGLGGNVWGAFLKIANKIEPQSNITIVLKYDENLSIYNTSDLSFNCPLFAIDRENIIVDNDKHEMVIPMMWNNDFVKRTVVENGSIDPVLIDPIGILTGLELVVNDEAPVNENSMLPFHSNVVVNYNLTALSSSAYGTVTKRQPVPEQYKDDPDYVPPYVYPELVQYAYINPADSRTGIAIHGEYLNYNDDFNLLGAPSEGWQGSSYIYKGQKLKGAYLIDGEVCYFDSLGNYDPEYVYYGLVNSLSTDDIYYSFENQLKSGWIYENDNYYYFDKKTFKAVDGVQTINNQTYTFENKILVDGYWYTTDEGTYLYWAGSRIWRKLFTVRGKTYYFNNNHLMETGVAFTFLSGTVQKYYVYGEDGVWMSDFTGLYKDIHDGKYYYVENGVSVYGKGRVGLVKVGDDYYYVDTEGRLITNRYYTPSKTNNLLPAAKYFFDSEGRLVPDDQIKNGIYEEDGALYYYKTHNRTAAGLVKIGDDYYYAQDGGLVATGETAVINNNKLLSQGVYIFDDTTGKMISKSDRSGLFETKDGKLYYLEKGSFKTGWINDDGNYYYFDPATYEAVDGEKEIDGVTYTFENCKLTKGVFITDENGTKYMFAGSAVTESLITDEGKTYYFGSDGYMVKGLQKIKVSDSEEAYYLFDDNGVWRSNFTGLYEEDGFNYYIENGVSVYGTDAAGLVKIENDYYYVQPDGTLAKDNYYLVSKTNGLLSYGTYFFDTEGKLVPGDQLKTGIFNEDGKLYYYESHHRKNAGWVTIDDAKYYAGEDGLLFTSPAIIDGELYFFDSEGKLCGEYDYAGLVPDNEGNLYYYDTSSSSYSTGWKNVDGNYYYFDPSTYKAVDGVQTISSHTYEFRDHILYDGDWVVTDAGTSLYWAGSKVWRRLVNAKGNTYYFNNNNLMETGLAYTFVTPTTQRYYLYAEDGAWMKDFTGIYEDSDGKNYYIVDGVSVYGKGRIGLIKIGEDYYYIDTEGQVVKDQFYNVSKTNDLLPADMYYFDADGKIDFSVIIKNGIYTDETDGKLYFYRNNEKYYEGLFKIGDDYYYANSDGLIATGVHRIYKTNNLLPADYYMFDETGKMIQGAELKDGIYRDDDGILYYYQHGLKTYAGLINIDGEYYYARTSGALAVSSYKISKTNNLLPAGTYDFREDGRMIQNRNGFVEVNGITRYYVDDEYVTGLAEIDGKYYYFSETDGAMTKGRSVVPADKSNSLFDTAKVFYFDEETGAADKALDFADYSALHEKYDSFAALDENIYTNYSDVNNVFDQVKAWENSNAELDETQQNLIDAKAQELENAIASLILNSVDTTAYVQAMATVPADLSIYTDASVDLMNEAKAAVENFLAGNPDITKQEEFNALVDSYVSSIAALEEKEADYTPLDNALAQFESVDGDLYSNYDDVKAVYDEVKSWKENNSSLTVSDQALIDEKAIELLNSIDTLTYKDADLTEIDELFAEFRALNPSLYSNYDRVKSEFDSAINALGAMPTPITIMQQPEIDNIARALRNALETLTYNPVDTSAYEQAKETVPADLSIYTDASVDLMNEAKAAVESFLAGNTDIRNQAELDALVDAYVQAIASLEEKPADYDALDNVIAEFEALDANVYSNYDEAKAVYDAVKAWRNNNPDKLITEQSEVDAQTQLLRDAIDSLTVVSRFGVKEGSTAVIDGNYIYGLKTRLTAANLRNTFLDYEGVEVTFEKAIEDARYYGTGSTVTVKYADGTEEVYTIVIFGDVDGNSIIDSDDAFAALEASNDNSLFSAVQRKAANVDGVRRISLDDYAIINDAALGLADIDQTAIA